MRLLILILVLTISAQPLQAGSCDMDLDKSQESPHHMKQMDHSDHQQQKCCDRGDSDTEGCDGQMQCGFCFATVPALPGLSGFTSDWAHEPTTGLSAGLILPSHSAPLFRPPKS